MKSETEILEIIKGNLYRTYRDKYPSYSHDVAVYNDLLWQINPTSKLDIEYPNGEAIIKKGAHTKC